MKRIMVLGSTGSIGKSTLDVVRKLPEEFEVVGLSAHSRAEDLLEQAAEFRVDRLALSGECGEPDERIRFRGEQGLIEMIEETEAHLVVNGIAGAKGLGPSVAALGSGKDLALANKETIVMAGKLMKELARRTGRTIIPVDSEHSAVFHLLHGRERKQIEEIVLTASGGAFRDLPLEALAGVTPAEALAHPTWSMGAKITIDSATMANKGLEVIEAHELFDHPVGRISVVIHPESRVHAMVRTTDGSLYAEVSSPDMRLPIQNALTWPDRLPCAFGVLDLAGVSLTFREPDERRYPLLALAYAAAGSGGAYPIMFNAANEVAVAAFMNGRIGFTGIAPVVERALEKCPSADVVSFDHVFRLDLRFRQTTEEILDILK